MGYHMKQNEYWGILWRENSILMTLFPTRAEVSKYLKENGYPRSLYHPVRVRLTNMDK